MDNQFHNSVNAMLDILNIEHETLTISIELGLLPKSYADYHKALSETIDAMTRLQIESVFKGIDT